MFNLVLNTTLFLSLIFLVKEPPSRWIVNFDNDLVDSLVLASLLAAYTPYIVSFLLLLLFLCYCRLIRKICPYISCTVSFIENSPDHLGSMMPSPTQTPKELFAGTLIIIAFSNYAQFFINI